MARTIAFLLSTLTLAACAEDDAMPEERWQLVWEDNFEGPEGSLPSPENWTYDIGRGQNGWGNNELQYYTDRPENVSLDGSGYLRIIARREAYEGAEWTSARLKTKGVFEFAYGRVEARIKLPTGKGYWPAFWMLGANIDEVGWPSCGEIDIMEARGSTPGEISGAMHGPGYSGGDNVGASYPFDETDITDFHVYRVDWDPNHVTWYVDGELSFTAHPGEVDGPWVFFREQFLLMNLAVGGVFDGDPNDATPTPVTMAVDYVRVYERTAPLDDPYAESP